MRVNIQGLAEILGVSRPTIVSWIDDGLPYTKAGSKGKPWEFETEEALPWWAENKHRRKSRTPAPGEDPSAPDDGRESIEEAERRKMIANADKAELELAKAARAVVLIDEVAGTIAEMHGRVRTRLLGIGNQVRMHARAFFGEDRAAEEQVVGAVEKVVADALADLQDDPFGEQDEQADTEA